MPSAVHADHCQEAHSAHIEKRAQAFRQLRRIAGTRNSPKSRSACGPKCRAVPGLPGVAPRLEARSRIPANTAGSPRLAVGKLRRLRGPTCSRPPLRHQFRLLQFIRCRFPVENAIVQNDSLKFHGHLGYRLRVSKKQVAARFQSVVEPLYQGAPPLFREIDENVHAKNHVHAADVDRRSKVHLRERNHFSQARLYLIPTTDFSKVVCQLLFAHASDTAAFVNPALGMFQSMPSDIRREYFHVPRIRERKRICDRDANGVGLFAGGTTGAPNSQRAGVLPEFLGVQFGQYPLLECFIHTRVAEKARFLRQQPLKQAFVFDVGFTHGAEQFRAALHSFCAQVFAHTRGEEALSRFIEANSRSLFDQHANLAQLVFAQYLPMSLAFAHRAPVIWAWLSLPPFGGEEFHFLTESACRDGPLGNFICRRCRLR